MRAPSLWIQSLWPSLTQDLRSWPSSERELGDKLFQGVLSITESSFLDQQKSSQYLHALMVPILLHAELLRQHEFLPEVTAYQTSLRIWQYTFQQKGEWPELNELHMHIRCQLVPYLLKREDLIKSHLLSFYEKQGLETEIPLESIHADAHERQGRL